MNILDEMRIDFRRAEALPEVDPQADRRAEIAEAYEKRREAEIARQWEEFGLPPADAPEPPRREEEPEGEAPERAATPDVRYPPVPATPPAAPQLLPMPLPDGRVTYVTPEQAAYLAQVGAATLSQPQLPPAPQQPVYVAPPPQQRNRRWTVSGRRCLRSGYRLARRRSRRKRCRNSPSSCVRRRQGAPSSVNCGRSGLSRR